MENEEIIKIVSKQLLAKFITVPEILSIYVYGSILTKKFSNQSDIDVLMIVKHPKRVNNILSIVKKSRRTVKGHKLDINIVFEEEFLRRWHIYRPPTYFFWIKSRSVLVFGEDLIKGVQEKEITIDTLYKRAVDLAQSSRSVYINNKDDLFWEVKYKRWVSTLMCELFYYDNKWIEFNSKECILSLIKKYPELSEISKLLKKRVTIKDISCAIETTSDFIRHQYL